MLHTLMLSDGASVAYADAGHGQPLVLVPGWSQTAAMFDRQTSMLREGRRVIAYDHRGHGESGPAGSGFRVARLAADLHELIRSRVDGGTVDVLAHSMGCPVVWTYWNLFGGERIRRLIFVDQGATLTAWHPGEVPELSGAPLTVDTAMEFVRGVLRPDPVALVKELQGAMLTDAVPVSERDWMLAEQLKLNRLDAARLWLDEALGDWRDVIPTITAPTLVIAGEVSFLPIRGPQWVADALPNSRLRIFTAAERGSHFMFWENPDLFNAVVTEFLDA